MRKIVSVLLMGAMVAGILSLTACKGSDIRLEWGDTSFTPIYGTSTNDEAYDYDSLIVNPVSGMRDDFIMGVDASMVLKVEECGGKYYNRDGKEQDVFQIMAQNGVNFFRVRVWNNPFDKFDNGYGGGDVNADRAVEMGKRAAAAGMKVMVDFHYSDTWADPETQKLPAAWSSMTTDELAEAVKSYTAEVLNKFKNAGVTVDMVQIGNEINNGLMWPVGRIDWNNPGASFDTVAKLLSAGIEGAKSVNKNIYTVIHLANGGNLQEFEDFFGYLEERKVDYDIIGASYYPYYHGPLDKLQANLDNVSKKYNKHVIIAEMSYGYTTETHPYAANTYNANSEDAGGYLTSLQGQATYVRDVIDVVAKVPEQKGLGVFYWEPAWLPVQGAAWATMASGLEAEGLSTWANQGLFSYTGKELPSLAVFDLVRTSTNTMTEVAQNVRTTEIDVTLNLAENEQMPDTYAVETNLDAIRQMSVVWDEADVAQLGAVGEYTVHGVVMDKFEVTARVTVIENFVKDPGYENQGATDAVLEPWIIEHSTPEGEKVVKLDRKSDTRTGSTDLNWYHSSQDFTFKMKQQITGLEPGTYQLGTYCMAISPNEKAHTELYIYITYNNGETQTYDLKDKVVGWGSKDTCYVRAEINDIQITSPDCEIGVVVSAPAAAWGHLDDWTLVRTD